MPDNSSSPLRGIGFAVLAFAVFSSHDAIIKTLGATYGVFQIIFFATLFAFLPMTIMMLADKEQANFRPIHPWLVSLRAFASVVSASCAFYAFTVLPMAEVYALLFSAPLLITALSVPLLGEIVRWQRWMAVIIGLIGVITVLRPGVSAFTFGHLCALTAACLIALSSIIIRKIGAQERSAVLIMVPMVTVIVVMAMLMPRNYIPVELPDLGLLALLGLLAVGGQIGTIHAFRAAPAALIAPVQYTQIIWAVIFGYLLFDEMPDFWVGIGSAIIISSGVFVVFRETRPQISDNAPVLRAGTQRAGAVQSPRPKEPVQSDLRELS